MENYLGSNFPQSSNPVRERATRDLVLAESRTYFRFVSFYFRDHAKTVINTLKNDPNVKIILDSGAYSAYTESNRRRKRGLRNWRVEIDMERYIKFVERFEPYLYGYVNLDVLNDGERSYANYQYMRSRGLDPIPVYHAETHSDFLDLYLKRNLEYVGIGAIANMNSKKRRERLDLLWKYKLTKDGIPITKVHAFGIGSTELLRRYPWYSADSTRWVSKHGEVYVPHYYKGNWIYDQTPIVVPVSVIKQNLPRNHFRKMSPEKRAVILQYFSDNGFSYGEFDEFSNEEPRVNSDGLFNRDDWRDHLNALYYVRMVQTIPPWPWPFKLTE